MLHDLLELVKELTMNLRPEAGYTDYELNIVGGIIIACELPGMVIAAICIGLFDFVRKVFRHISGGTMSNNESSNNVVDFPTPNEDDK